MRGAGLFSSLAGSIRASEGELASAEFALREEAKIAFQSSGDAFLIRGAAHESFRAVAFEMCSDASLFAINGAFQRSGLLASLEDFKAANAVIVTFDAGVGVNTVDVTASTDS